MKANGGDAMTTAVDDWERKMGRSVDVVETPLGMLEELVRKTAYDLFGFENEFYLSRLRWQAGTLGLLFAAMAEEKRSEDDLGEFLIRHGKDILAVPKGCQYLGVGLGATSIDFQMIQLREVMSDLEVRNDALMVFLSVLGGHCAAGRMEDARRLMDLCRSSIGMDELHKKNLRPEVSRLFSNEESIRMFREAGWEWPLVKAAMNVDLEYLLKGSPVSDTPLRAKAAVFLLSNLGIPLLDTSEAVKDRSFLLEKTPRMRQAFEADDGALFMVEMALQGRRITKGMVQTLVLKEKYNILSELIRQTKEFVKVCPPEKLLFQLLDGVSLWRSARLKRIITQGPCADVCITAIRSLEQTFPGVVKYARDSQGADALLHLLRSACIQVYGDVRPSLRRLEELLISLGCDPNRQIKALGGLSYAQVSEAFWEMTAQEAEQD